MGYLRKTYARNQGVKEGGGLIKGGVFLGAYGILCIFIRPKCPPCLSASIPDHILTFLHLLTSFSLLVTQAKALWNRRVVLLQTWLTQLLAILYSTGAEQQFLYYSTNLLLEFISHSPDFNRSKFGSLLSKCKYEVRMSSRQLKAWELLHIKNISLMVSCQMWKGWSENETTILQ